MVYFPKTNFLKKVIDEFMGFLAAIFVSRLVVATTGGSLAFASNLSVNAFANGIGFAVVYAIWPHVFLDITLIICKFFDDMLQYFMGLKNLMLLEFATYFVLILAQFVAGLFAYLLVWVFVDSSVSDLGLPKVPSSVEGGRAFAAEFILSMFFVFGFFYISQMYNKTLLKAKVENLSSSSMKPTPIEMSDGMVVTPQLLVGVDTFSEGAWTRAILLGLLRVGLSLGGVPITGGLFNTMGYVTGGIVSWTWDSTYYVQAFGPLAGIVGYFAYVCVYYIPKLPVYGLLFGNDAATPEQLSQDIARATKLPTFRNQNQIIEGVSDDYPDFYYKVKRNR